MCETIMPGPSSHRNLAMTMNGMEGVGIKSMKMYGELAKLKRTAAFEKVAGVDV